jgi:hypothetical protein
MLSLFKKTKKEIVPSGFVNINESLPEDIFIVGYPKSGNTWFQNLVAGVVHGVLPEFAPPALAILTLVPDVHYNKYYYRYSTPTYFKSHHFPQKKYKKVVYLIRDGRDVMISYYHFLMAMQEKVDFLKLVKNGHFPGKWHEHVEFWISNPYAAEIMIIKYEDLKKNTAHELKRFCDFAGIERDQDFIKLVANSSVFEKLQAREKRLGQGATPSKWMEGKFFYRRGEVGGYKNEMPQNVLDCFIQQAAPTLDKLGYLNLE